MLDIVVVNIAHMRSFMSNATVGCICQPKGFLRLYASKAQIFVNEMLLQQRAPEQNIRTPTVALLS